MLYALIVLQCLATEPVCVAERSETIVIRRKLDAQVCGVIAAAMSGTVGDGFRYSARCRLEAEAPPAQ